MSSKLNSDRNKKERSTPAETGNASNPSPHDESTEPASNQLLDEKAEKYLRESASIEDYPDAQDQAEADEIFKKENDNS
jgi:hypothetical protein